jgi:putative restriction endonuclease
MERIAWPRLCQRGKAADNCEQEHGLARMTGPLPPLEAAHIKPFAPVQAHEITNGLSLRSDIHRLYDLGYVSVRPDYTFAVSKQIREEFENGRDYYALDGRPVSVPRNPAWQPDPELLDWHYSERYHGR